MNATNNILKNINRYVSLNTADEDQFLKIVTTKQVRKKEILVQPNSICQHQTYVVQGTLRSYFLTDNGEEHTIQFAVDDWFISDFNSYVSQTPASLYVEAIKDSTIQQITYQDVENLCLTNPKFERFFRLVAQKAFAYSQRRILSNIANTAKERYQKFYSLYPEIVQQVPQYMLASYLGMSSEFLSKIRKKNF